MNVLNQYVTDQVALYQGDCVEVVKGLPDASVHLTISSLPFSSLYIYSESTRDMGNNPDDAAFFAHMGHLIPELHRVTVPGRLCVMHCKQLVNYRGRDGMAGLRDFRGDIIRAFTAQGWAYHSEVCIWLDPVLEMQRTKAHGLLYKTLKADASHSRQGMADYLLVFRRWPHGEDEEARAEPVRHNPDDFPLETWQRYASPVWMDVDRTRVLNVELAREGKDERHICPLQLDVIERCLDLWTNPGDVVLDPFIGVGSVAVASVKRGRRTVGVELKASYHGQSIRFVEQATIATAQPTLFDLVGVR